MIYIIPGDPIPLKRPRFSQHSVWDSQKANKLCTGITIKNQHGEKPFYEPPIAVKLTFYFKMPKKVNGKRGIHQFDPYCHTPDADNALKYILDVCSGILFKDDRFVTQIELKKLYDYEPRTEMEIWTL